MLLTDYLGIRVTPDIREKLQQLAQAEQCKLSDVARLLIHDGLAQRGLLETPETRQNSAETAVSGAKVVYCDQQPN